MMKYVQLPSAVGNSTQHYANLNHYNTSGLPAISMAGHWWEIDDRTYEYFLGVLPPVYVRSGFRLIETLTERMASHFYRVGDRYWCGYTYTNSEFSNELLLHILLESK